MKKIHTNPRGCSYTKKVARVHEIYDQHKHSGLSNRAIWRIYIHPETGICESTFYKISKVIPETQQQKKEQNNKQQLSIFPEHTCEQ